MSEQAQPIQGTASVTRQLMALLQAREERGIATYGRSLETFNGRSAPQDLVEELVDAAQYALQWQLEREEMLERFARIADLLGGTRAILTAYGDIHPDADSLIAQIFELTECLKTSV